MGHQYKDATTSRPMSQDIVTLRRARRVAARGLRHPREVETMSKAVGMRLGIRLEWGVRVGDHRRPFSYTRTSSHTCFNSARGCSFGVAQEPYRCIAGIGTVP